MPSENIEDASRMLLARLEDEAQLFRDHPEKRREAAIYSLNAVIEFLRTGSAVVEGHLDEPLQALAVALSELDRGGKPKLLEPPYKVAGNRKQPKIREYFQPFVAASVDLLIATGIRKKEAEKLVADCLRRHGMETAHAGPGRGRKITPTTVEKWREKLRRSPNSEAAAEYWELIRAAKLPDTVTTSEQARRWWIARLSEVAATASRHE
jgi:hypothetical protein